ncbi:MAG: hypothetical protein ACJAZO_004814 [Myxococcota bacterium]
MIATLLALALTASAQDPDIANRREAVQNSSVPDWSVQTYTAPNTGLEVLCAAQAPGQTDCLTVHLAAAASAGVMFRYKEAPDWFGEVRVAGEFRYGLLSNGYGLEVRIGSFWGIDRTRYRVTMGPDFIGNVYQGQDYILRPGIGVGWVVTGVLKPLENLWIIGSIQPAVFFANTRKVDSIAIIDELVYKIGAQYQGGPVIGAGYTWRYNAGGIQQGFYVGGSF